MDIALSLNTQLSKVNPIVEGFVTIGITADNIDSHINYKEPLNPKVLTKFPPDFKPPETISMFCFPEGVKLVKSHSEVESKLFNFILTDENGGQIFCAAMIIFECPGNDKKQAKIFRNTRPTIETKIGNTSQEDICLLTPQSVEQNRRSKSVVRNNSKNEPENNFLKPEGSFQFISTNE